MTGSNDSDGIEVTRFEAILAFLEGAGISCELVEHEPTMSASADARATHKPPDQAAKTIFLHDGKAYMVVAVPASERLDLNKVRELFNATRHLRLASEEEIAADFPTLEVGAIPPFGPMLPAAEVIDRRLLAHDRILVPAGDHRHSVLVDPRDILRVTAATTADICEE